MNNLYKFNEKNQRKVYSKSDRAITLIALIVTIIILLILAGVTINLAVNDKGIFSKAKKATEAYKKTNAGEQLGELLYEYQIEKATNDNIKLIDFLKDKNGVDEVADNGDGTLSVTSGDYVFKIKDDGSEITSTEELKGIAPKVEYAVYSDTAGANKIDTSKKYDKEYIGVKVTNASDYTSAPTLVLTNSSGSTVTSTSVSGFNGYYEATQDGTYTLKVTGTNGDGTRSKTQTIVIGNLNVLAGSTILRSKAPKISVNGLKYADLDNDGEADGIIVADLMADPTKDVGTGKTYAGGNPVWNDGRGSFSYTKKSESELNTYETENENYTYTGGGSSATGTLIKCTDKTKNSPRYYIISLGDYDTNYHCWYYNAYYYDKDGDGTKDYMYDYKNDTKEDFGAGINNTNNMITAWNNKKYGEQNGGSYTDIWGVVQDKVKEGWFVPSRAEWTAFASYLNTSKTSSYVNYGLSAWYWSSSQFSTYHACSICFDSHSVLNDFVSDDHSVRLASTF